MTAILSGKRGLVVGVSSARSLGFAVAKSWLRHGADHVTVLCKDDRIREGVEGLFSDEKGKVSFDTCDVLSDTSLDRCFMTLRTGDGMDMVLHSVAFAPKEAAKSSSLLSLSRANFSTTMEASVYSLIAVAKRVNFRPGASLLTLTFDGTSRPLALEYASMAPAKSALESTSLFLASELGAQGIRVNCISPGPVATPSARGLSLFPELRAKAAKRSALRRSIVHEDVANAAVFLSSQASSAITGQVIKVDCGSGLAFTSIASAD